MKFGRSHCARMVSDADQGFYVGWPGSSRDILSKQEDQWR